MKHASSKQFCFCWLLLGLLAACGPGAGVSLWGSATNLPGPTEPPAPPEQPPFQTLGNGLKLSVLQGEPGPFQAAFLVAAGPLNDPASRPGLTTMLPRMALLGTEDAPHHVLSPLKRALHLGGHLVPVANGTLMGWVVSGPAKTYRGLLKLLADVALKPVFPANGIELLTRDIFEEHQANDRLEIERAIELITGMALGLGRPLPLAPTEATLAAVNREDVLRHWRRLVRPPLAVLVISGTDDRDAARQAELLFGDWPDSAMAPLEHKPCLPQGQHGHIILTTTGDNSHEVTLFALAVPGPGHPQRLALEVILAYLGEQPGGPIEEAVGTDQAIRAIPRLVDLGHNDRGGASVVLAGSAGDAQRAVHDLSSVIRLLAGNLKPVNLDPEMLKGAHRAVRGERLADWQDSRMRLLKVAERAHYGQSQAALPADFKLETLMAQTLKPWQIAFGGVGSERLLEPMRKLAPVTLWNTSGEKTGGDSLPRCAPPDTAE